MTDTAIAGLCQNMKMVQNITYLHFPSQKSLPSCSSWKVTLISEVSDKNHVSLCPYQNICHFEAYLAHIWTLHDRCKKQKYIISIFRMFYRSDLCFLASRHLGKCRRSGIVYLPHLVERLWYFLQNFGFLLQTRCARPKKVLSSSIIDNIFLDCDTQLKHLPHNLYRYSSCYAKNQLN